MRPEELDILSKEKAEAREVARLKSKFLDKFFQDKEAMLFEAFKHCPIGAVDDLNNIHHQLKSLNALKTEVQSVMDTGKMAEIALSTELDKSVN